MDLSRYQTAALQTAENSYEHSERQLLLWTIAWMGEVSEVLGLAIRAYVSTDTIEDEDEKLLMATAYLGYYVGALCDAVKKRVGHRHQITDAELEAILDKAWQSQERLYDALRNRKVKFPVNGFGRRPSPEEIADETGDALWHNAVIAALAGFDLSDIAEYNLEKLSIRYPSGFSYEASRNRVR